MSCSGFMINSMRLANSVVVKVFGCPKDCLQAIGGSYSLENTLYITLNHEKRKTKLVCNLLVCVPTRNVAENTNLMSGKHVSPSLLLRCVSDVEKQGSTDQPLEADEG